MDVEGRGGSGTATLSTSRVSVWSHMDSSRVVRTPNPSVNTVTRRQSGELSVPFRPGGHSLPTVVCPTLRPGTLVGSGLYEGSRPGVGHWSLFFTLIETSAKFSSFVSPGK